ncbi:MAG: S-layer homology domain-containing protein [Tissierellia bacterium]|nr:S-layer homology domain-containing protein [Tissierellia bacterium]
MKLAKKIIPISLAATLLFPLGSLAKSFPDVTRDGNVSWAYEAVNYLSDQKILNGFPDGSFKPNYPVSFQESMQIIKTLFKPDQEILKKAVETYGEFVTSQGVDPWAKEAVCFNLYIQTITEKTLAEGNQRGFLKSPHPVYPSRNSIAVYMGRALGVRENRSIKTLQYEDLEKIPAVTLTYLPDLVEKKIFTPTGSEGKFNGTQYVRRSEMAIIANQTLAYLNEGSAQSEEKPQESWATQDLGLSSSELEKPQSEGLFIEEQSRKEPTIEKSEPLEIKFEGIVEEVISSTDIHYIQVRMTKVNPERPLRDPIITIYTSREYKVGDMIQGSGKWSRDEVRDIKIN